MWKSFLKVVERSFKSILTSVVEGIRSCVPQDTKSVLPRVHPPANENRPAEITKRTTRTKTLSKKIRKFFATKWSPFCNSKQTVDSCHIALAQDRQDRSLNSQPFDIVCNNPASANCSKSTVALPVKEDFCLANENVIALSEEDCNGLAGNVVQLNRLDKSLNEALYIEYTQFSKLISLLIPQPKDAQWYTYKKIESKLSRFVSCVYPGFLRPRSSVYQVRKRK